MARKKVPLMTQWTSGKNVFGRVFMSKKGTLSIYYNSRAYNANVYKQIYAIDLTTSRELLLSIFCISQNSVVTRLRFSR